MSEDLKNYESFLSEESGIVKVCSWCPDAQELTSVILSEIHNKLASHGICQPCADNQVNEMRNHSK